MRNFFRAITTLILKWEAKLYIALNKPIIIAIAGITGKNALKRTIAQELNDRGINVRAHPKCYNTDIGLPMAILFVEPESYTPLGWIKTVTKGLVKCLSKDQKRVYMVVELGVSEAGDMKKLLDIVKPQILFILDIIEHPQSGVSAAVLFDEIKLAIGKLPADGALLLNTDFLYFDDVKQKFPNVKIVTYGFAEQADFRLELFNENNNGVSFLLNGEAVQIIQHGKNSALFYAAAKAVSSQLK